MDKSYTKLTLKCLSDLIDDLDEISVQNGDFLNEEVDTLKTMVEDVDEKVELHFSEGYASTKDFEESIS
jgi:hypothetical protein